MLKNIPKWLVDSSGPLSVRPAYLPYASSWLLKWIRSGASERNAFRLSHALRQLHQNAIDGYRALLGPGYFDETIRSAERRVGKECVSTCRSRWSPYH